MKGKLAESEEGGRQQTESGTDITGRTRKGVGRKKKENKDEGTTTRVKIMEHRKEEKKNGK